VDSYLDPLSSPDGMPAVRRLNHIPLYVLGGVAVVIMLIIVMVAADKSKQAAAPAEDHGGNTDSFAQQAAGSASGYIPAARTPTPVPATTPMDVSTPAPTPDAEAESRRKAFYESLYAPSAVADPLITQREQAAAQPTVTPSPALPSPVMPQFPAAAPTPIDPNSLATYAGQKDRWRLDNRVEKPASKYILQTGWLIPALMITAMESQLPGYISAQVSQNVYDSPTGKYLLIPQGTRLFGAYSDAISYGQNKIFVAWQRLIFPNGNTLDISAMPGVDGQGEAGFHDQTNNHMFSIFASAILMSAISGATALSQPQQTFSNAPNLESTLSAALGQQLGAATTSLLEKNLSVPPTLKIRQGYGFNVVAVKDLVFDRPYVVPNY
jgi:type IV secretory pathway VirB10-like protein